MRASGPSRTRLAHQPAARPSCHQPPSSWALPAAQAASRRRRHSLQQQSPPALAPFPPLSAPPPQAPAQQLLPLGCGTRRCPSLVRRRPRHGATLAARRPAAQPVASAAPARMSTTPGRSRRGTGPAPGEAPSPTPASACIIVLGDSQPADDCFPAAGDGPSPPPSKRRRGEAKPGDGEVVILTGEEEEDGAAAAKPPPPKPRARPSGAPSLGAAARDCDDVIFVAEVAGKPPVKKAPGPAVVDLTRDPPPPSADAAVREFPSSPYLCMHVCPGRVLPAFASLPRPTSGHTTKAQMVPRPPPSTRAPPSHPRPCPPPPSPQARELLLRNQVLERQLAEARCVASCQAHPARRGR